MFSVCSIQALKIRAPKPQFSVVSHDVGEALGVLMACAAMAASGFGAWLQFFDVF